MAAALEGLLDIALDALLGSRFDVGKTQTDQVVAESVLFLPADLGLDGDRRLPGFEQDTKVELTPLGKGLFVVDPHARGREVQGEHTEAGVFALDLHLYHQDPFESEGLAPILLEVMLEKIPNLSLGALGHRVELQAVDIHAAHKLLLPDPLDLHVERAVEMEPEGNRLALGEVVLRMNPHPAFTEVVNMNQAVLDVALTEDVGRKDLLDGGLSSGQGTPFHSGRFGSQPLSSSPVGSRWIATFGIACWLWLLALPASALPFVNKDGQRVELSSHLVAGKDTVVFFHAPWSKASGRYLAELTTWSQKQLDTAVIGVQVKALDSPVARQYQVTEVPFFLIYDGEGQLTHRGTGALSELLQRMKAKP